MGFPAGHFSERRLQNRCIPRRVGLAQEEAGRAMCIHEAVHIPERAGAWLYVRSAVSHRKRGLFSLPPTRFFQTVYVANHHENDTFRN